MAMEEIMKIPFTKMHGLGNSYIYINLFETTLSEEVLVPLAIEVANPNTGIGSDGLILIQPSKVASVGMRIFNKDGSEGKTCGNGLRCVAKYAYEHGLVADRTFLIETKAGNVKAEVHETKREIDEVTIDMGTPSFRRNDIPMTGEDNALVILEPFDVSHHPLQLTAVSMGNPHAVFFVDNIEKAPLYELGPVITNDHRFPEGVNVEFIEVINSTELHFRVWERGSGVTQACGTGACAAAVAAIQNGYVTREQEITVHLSGGDLYIRWSDDDRVWMRGKAERTIEGYFYTDSF